MTRGSRFGVVLLIAGVVMAAAAGTRIAGDRGRSHAVVSQDSLSPALIARGDSIFHGKVAGGTCFTCHGPEARGMPGLGANLRDTVWLNVNGSYSSIVEVISKGVPRPKQAIAPMLPMGGARLSQEQIRAVAAYVYNLRNVR